MPPWSELREFEIRAVGGSANAVITPGGDETLVVIASGSVRTAATDAQALTPGDSFSPDGTPIEALSDAAFVTLRGNWTNDRGKCGIFTPHDIADPLDGDAVDYHKDTKFDSHYHDCDEHWIIIRGSGVAVTEGQAFDVGPGDCISTRQGDHHDFPIVHEPVLAVFFETSMRGRLRRGHLWEHTHGPARPVSQAIAHHQASGEESR